MSDARFRRQARDSLMTNNWTFRLRVLRQGSPSKEWRIAALRGKRILGIGEHRNRNEAERLAQGNARAYMRMTDTQLYALIRETGKERGQKAESSVLETLRNALWPKWLRNIQRSSEEEDLYHGIDFLATVEGVEEPIPIQLKSSESGVQKFLEKNKDLNIIVIKVLDRQDAAFISQIFFETLRRRRWQLLKARVRECLKELLTKPLDGQGGQ